MTLTYVAVLVPVMLACASATHRDTDQPQPSNAVVVMVRNDNLNDADIYAVRLSARYRLGTVNALSSERFRVPVSMLNDNGLQVFVHLIGGGGDYLSDFVQVDEELEPRLDLKPALEMSMLYAVTR